MRMFKGQRGRHRVRKSYPNITTDVFSDPFEDEYELGDDVADEICGGGAPARNNSDVPSGNG